MMPAILIHVPATLSLDGQRRIEHMSRMQQDLAQSKLSYQSNGISEAKMFRRLAATGRKPRVAIVGAGFAGLRAADVLLKHGVGVTIFEARDRVGGRLCQARVGSHLVDMGPNWIHGTQNNPVLDLVHSTGTPTHDWPEKQVAFAPSGSQLPADVTSETAELVWSLIGDAFKYSNESSSDIDPGMSLMDYVVQHAEERLNGHLGEGMNDSVKAEQRKDLVIKLAELWGGFIGATTQRQSLKFLWLEECLEGENLFCAGTYSKVLNKVSAPARQAADLKFNHVVTKISSGQRDNEYLVKLRMRDRQDEEFEFDEVIVTCPLGWLKRHKDVFEPELPPRISRAIDDLGYGNLDKVYITFSTAWWDTSRAISSTAESRSPSAYDSMPNVAASTIPLKQAIQTTIDEQEHYSSFTTFIAPEYAEDTNPHGWFQDCINLAALPSGTEHPTLLFYISGPTSDHIANMLSNRESSPTSGYNKASTDVKSKIYRFFEPYISRLPNYTAGASECSPTDVLATGWTNDEFAGYGSYSNFPVGAVACDRDIEAMREGKGLVERGIWLAGEHTAPFVASGTVTGAYWAGEKTAERVLDAWGLGGKIL